MAEYSSTNPSTVFKGRAEMEGTPTVSAKFTVTRYNLRDRNPSLNEADDRIVVHLRRHYRILRGEFDQRPI